MNFPGIACKRFQLKDIAAEFDLISLKNRYCYFIRTKIDLLFIKKLSNCQI